MQASSLPDEQTLMRLVVAKRQLTVARFSQVSADGAVFMNRVQSATRKSRTADEPCPPNFPFARELRTWLFLDQLK